jgi:transposase
MHIGFQVFNGSFLRCGGAERWATVCSLITTAKLNDVEPFAHLKDVLQRMSNGHRRLDDLLPWNWRPPTALN